MFLISYLAPSVYTYVNRNFFLFHSFLVDDISTLMKTKLSRRVLLRISSKDISDLSEMLSH